MLGSLVSAEQKLEETGLKGFKVLRKTGMDLINPASSKCLHFLLHWAHILVNVSARVVDLFRFLQILEL